MIIFKKTILALTGLFICIFLVAHLGANFLLLLPHETARTCYNAYSAALRSNPFITIIAYINYLCIIFHVIYAILVTVKNNKSRNEHYEMNRSSENSSWTSQNMLLLGFLILGFIIIHMANFWYKVKILHQEDDLYQMVFDLFHEPLYLIIYVAAAIPIGLHLSHGVQSAFKTLGLYHHKYIRWIAKFSVMFAWITGLGFAIIPIVVYFR
ncbi:MAG: succinate dehydrogenase cytochrome b subunit [Bacteriovoracaceae bacterium]|nr:succinate dehydrogenase cytochrome b subunit [Bacteriovoracaceae bacterium]